MTDDSRLLATLASIRERGAIGEASLEAAIQHAAQFVALVPPTARTLVDLGSGGGLPGLVIAMQRPDLQIVLVERRIQRADLLRRAVSSLAIGEYVSVQGSDVRDVASVRANTFDVVTARSFAAPDITARWASKLLVQGGRLIVSEPPTDDAGRWPATLMGEVGLVDMGRQQGIRWFVRS